MAPLNIALAMGPSVAERMFPSERLAALDPELVLLSPRPLADFTSPDAAAVLARVDALVTGWGCPPLTEEVLALAPNLRFVLHAAGSVKGHVGEAVFNRGIRVSTAADANAIPVAEYTLAMILLANKKVLQLAATLKSTRNRVPMESLYPAMGNYGQRIGVVGASRIGRALLGLLKPFAFDVVVFDPYLSDAEAAELGVTAVGLDELLSTSDVVTVHAPEIPATRHMIDERALGLIRPGATFINTSRGSLVDQDALVRRIQGGDLYAVLDVTTPELLDPDHPFYDHPNVLLTPHAAGSLGVELARLADTALAEAGRAARGEELLYALDQDILGRTA
ncbi:hydroxyacid dehydrogenase [Arthrobacter sp. 35W]|uniref:hydroxyacid dehydrogenase n=1 Tax=Arthrobacter sp. 35W TaxID=1132441 RepID=UPI00041A9E6E|nr:hydroxyacid dehydrogenase [Arthrobacter sp. 35W]